MTGRAEATLRLRGAWAAHSEARDDRITEYARLRGIGYTLHQAKARMRISERTAYRYEAAMKETT